MQFIIRADDRFDRCSRRSRAVTDTGKVGHSPSLLPLLAGVGLLVARMGTCRPVAWYHSLGSCKVIPV